MPNPKSTIELMRMMFKLNPELKLGWGSNLLGKGVGKAGAGQAEFAGEIGAVYGQGRGAAGRTFAIPTKTAPHGRARTIHEIQPEIKAFGEHVKATDNPWFLAAIGTGRGRGMKSVDQASTDIAKLVQDQGLFELENLAVSKKLLNSIHQPQNPLGIKLYESIASKNWHAPPTVIPREAIAESIKTTKKINTSFKGSMHYPIKGKSTIKSRTTFDAITAGERTMTTRRVGLGWENRKVGEVFPIKGKGSQTQLIEITHEPTIHTVTGKESQAFLNRWSQLEGHGPEQFHKHFYPGEKITMVKFKPATSGGTMPTTVSGKKIYHGTRNNNPESFIDAEGNLVLKASENFSGKQVGVSFSEDMAVSRDYASRVAGQGPVRNPTQGAVFEIEKDAITDKLFAESAEEIATRGRGDVVIPKGKFKIIKDSKKQSVDDQLKAWEQKEIATESKYAKARSNKELGGEEEKRLIDEYSAMDDGGDINYRIADGDYVSMAITNKWGDPGRIGRGPGAGENMNEITRRISTSKDPEKTALEILQGAGVENIKNPHPVYAELINEIMTAIGPQSPSSPLRKLTQKLGMGYPLEIISGGQVGADQMGLRIGKALGIKTGGTAPPRFQTSKGPDLKLRDEYGLVEGAADPRIYPLRTLANVKNSDGTIIVANNWSSGGTKATQRFIKQEGKPSLLSTQINSPQDVVNWMTKNDIRTINIAGNRSVTKENSPSLMHIFNALKTF
jgi:hypothetical protein